MFKMKDGIYYFISSCLYYLYKYIQHIQTSDIAEKTDKSFSHEGVIYPVGPGHIADSPLGYASDGFDGWEVAEGESQNYS